MQTSKAHFYAEIRIYSSAVWFKGQTPIITMQLRRIMAIVTVALHSERTQKQGKQSFVGSFVISLDMSLNETGQ